MRKAVFHADYGVRGKGGRASARIPRRKPRRRRGGQGQEEMRTPQGDTPARGKQRQGGARHFNRSRSKSPAALLAHPRAVEVAARERRPLAAGTRTRRTNETAKRRRETAEGADAPRARGAPRRLHARRVCRTATATARGSCLARRIGRGALGRSAGERRRMGTALPRGARRTDETTRGEKRRFAHIATP